MSKVEDVSKGFYMGIGFIGAVFFIAGLMGSVCIVWALIKYIF